MTYPEAALKILEEAGRPLDYQQITALAIERNWIEPQGPDPATIMNTLIMQDLKTKGVRSEFSRLGPGTYALRKLVYKNSPPADDPPPPAAAPHARRGRPRRDSGNTERPMMDRQPMERPKPDRPRPDRPPAERRHTRPQRPPRPPAKVHEAPRPEYAAPRPEYAAPRPEGEPALSAKELWGLMETFGTIMGYKILPVLLSDGKTHCMGWHIGGNPELAFILWVTEGTDMKSGIEELLALNYHKAVVMAAGPGLAEAESFLVEESLTDKADVISLGLLGAQASAGIRYMSFYNRLCDCRPAKERRGFTLD
jgi:hypothetical protein